MNTLSNRVSSPSFLKSESNQTEEIEEVKNVSSRQKQLAAIPEDAAAAAGQN